MGAAAFVLSDIASTPYALVCIAALLPALMYYVTLFKMVDLDSVKHKLLGLPPEDIPSLKTALTGSHKLIIPVAVLLAFLLIAKTTPMLAAIYSMGILAACGFLDRKDRLTPRRFLEGFVEGSRSMPQVVAACAASGIITGMFALTGLGLKLSDFIMHLGDSSVILSLALSMLICLVLGMGLPTTAAYIISATAVAPALVKIGVPVLAAHLFILYFASISSITPPVAVASYAAAGIAEENALKVSLSAVKLGVAGFALPFTFALNPDYLHFGFDLLTLFTWVSAFAVCYSAAIVLQGYVEQKITIAERVLYCAVIVTAIQSSYAISLAGWILFAVLFVSRRFWKKRNTLSAVSETV
jgi:TRAP transporter 4TM/12TM fusion protein